jgi:hypothetical protein
MRFFGAASAVICVLGDRRCKRVFGIHGGRTPPAPVLRCECLPAKSDFCDGRTHVPKSGGRQPAEARDTDAVPQQPSMVPRTTNGQRRAAGVSPPWIANAGAIADVFHGRLTPTAPGARRSSAEQGAIGSAPTHVHKSGDRQPAVARNESRLQGTANNVRPITPGESGAAGVSPPWVCKPRLQMQCDELPRCEFGCGMTSTGG